MTFHAVVPWAKQRNEKFAFSFEGFVKIMQDGLYHFYTQSDDGSQLFIDGEMIVDNGGDHGSVERSGKPFLRKGYYKIGVTYFDGTHDCQGLKTKR